MIRIAGIVLLVVFFFITSTEGSDDIIVIVNVSNTMTEISQSDLVRIYSGRKSLFNNKIRIIPLDLDKNNSLRKQFYETVLNKNMDKMKTYWIKRIFSGSGSPPMVLKKIEDIKRYVADNEGAIGYIDKSSIDDSIKVVNLALN